MSKTNRLSAVSVSRFFKVFGLIAALSVSAFAQPGYEVISGSVVDQNGDAIAGALVLITRADESVRVTSDKDGAFRAEVEWMPPYTITVSATDFESKVLENVALGKLEQPIVLRIDPRLVTVTADLGKTTLIRDSVVPVSKIESEELSQRTSGVLSGVGATETGLNVQSTSPTIGAIVVRGLTGKNVVNYIDGVRYTNTAQRGGINTFFNLNDFSNLNAVEVLRGPDSAQYGSDSLGGTVNLVSKANPRLGSKGFSGEVNSAYSSANRGFRGGAMLALGTADTGFLFNGFGYRSNTLRTADGMDSHSAYTRYLGLPSDLFYRRNPDTEFTQYGGSLRVDQNLHGLGQFVGYYQRSQQDGGKRFDQLIGGDGNLIADLRNLMGDFGYARLAFGNTGFFDNGSITVSYNSQREERVNQGGRGNPLASVTHQYERTTAIGISGFAGKSLSERFSLLAGGELYNEGINSPAFTFRPTDGTFVVSRPRVPDEASYLYGAVFLKQDARFFDSKLRVSGAIRYSAGSYRARAADSPIVNGSRLWEDDSLGTGDFSGRIGFLADLTKKFSVGVNYSRGFRFPSMTDLGTLGLTGDGFEVDAASAVTLGGTIGSTADSSAVDTGIAVSKQTPEYSDNFDIRGRFDDGRLRVSLGYFRLFLSDTIVKQALILPSGAVGQQLADQIITDQLPNGVVFVPLSSAPVLVRANYTSAVLNGIEFDAGYKISERLRIDGGYTYIHAADDETGEPPNIEGGTPPPNGFVKLGYANQKGFWIEGIVSFADRQTRLSSLDLGDRRTAAPRSLSQVADFFRRGACARGLTNNPDGVCGTGDETILLATGETLPEVQQRVLGGASSGVLFPYLPGYGLVSIRGGYRFTRKASVFWAAENILDQFHRNPSWGIDGAGRGFRGGVRVGF
ncbi:MAG: TonB-dependent receptor [Pyrinomonadaceae bacterium]